VTSCPILYSFRRCPFAMRARLALLSSASCCELREVVLRDKPAQLLEISPKGTVPVLLFPDGKVLEQSLDIMLWALEQHDPEGWLPATPTARSAHLALIKACDGDFKSQLDRYKYPQRFGMVSNTSARDQGAVYLANLEQRLADERFLSGKTWGLADAAIAPFVRQWAHTDPTWFAQQTWPKLQAWLQQFEQSPAFLAIMVKVAIWKPEAERTFFGV
jgi:glutathione S-transferase